MKFEVDLLNYDSKWVNYCTAPTEFYAEKARADLKAHGFKDHQIRVIGL